MTKPVAPTTKDLLPLLNKLRVAAGKTEMKAWKDGLPKLHIAIQKLKDAAPKVEHETSSSEHHVKLSDIAPKVAAAVKAANVNGKSDEKVAVEQGVAKALAKKATTPAKSTSDGVTIATIAASLNMGEKVARAKLRRAEPPFKTLEEGRWVFAAKDVEAIKQFLRGDGRKKS